MDLINKSKLDPISMYSTIKIEVMLTREEMAVPDKDDDDNDDVQRANLIQVCVERGLVHVSDGGVIAMQRVCLVCACYRVILSLQHVKEQLPLPNVPQAVGGELPAAAIAPAAVPVPAPV